MNTKLHLIVLLLITTIGYSQVSKNYKQLSNKDNANYYTIVADARAEFATKDLTVLANKKTNKQFERWAYHWENKIGTDGSFPNENAGYFNAGILDVEGKLTGTTTNRSALSAETWTNVSPIQADLNNNGYSNYPQMGRLNAFLRIKHPSDINQDVLFVGAPGGGIWKSTDGGANWVPKLDQVAGIGVTDIKTVPGTTTANYTTQPIYVSTGDWDGGHVKSIGVLKSTDGGETFTSTGLSYTLDQQKITGDLIVHDANTVFVGASQYIKKTTDGGTTWTNAHDTQVGNGNPGRVAVNGTEAMYTGLWDLFYNADYTNDAGWVVIAGSYQNKRAVTVDQNGEFYIQNQDGQIQLYDKINNTLSDVGNIPGGYNSQGGYNQALVVNNDIMVTGEFNGQSSVDNGVNWTTSLNGYWNNSSSPGTYIHSDHHRMGQLDGNLNLWSVNDGGLSYITYPNTSSTTPTIDYKSGKVIVTQSYSVAINPNANDGAIVAANQDNDAFSKTSGQWYAVAMGDGIQSAINYNNPMIRYAGNQNGNVYQTDTGFVNQLQGNGNTVQIPGASFYFPLEMDKASPNRLYGGGNDVYKIDATATGLTIAATNAGFTGNITSIATQASFTVASSATELKYTTNSGTTWTALPAPNAGGGNITSVDIKANGGAFYATRGGYSATNKVQKYLSSWVDITGDLPNIVVNEIMLKQNQASGVEILFLATELGVYYTTNANGASTQWSKLGANMPNVNVKDIEIHYTADKLIAGTFGRGLWEIPIGNSTLGTTSIENELAGISVYPNPAVNSINVKLPNNDNYSYVIYNVVGGVVKKGTLDNNTSIDVSNLIKNIYMIRVYNETSSITKKIILK